MGDQMLALADGVAKRMPQVEESKCIFMDIGCRWLMRLPLTRICAMILVCLCIPATARLAGNIRLALVEDDESDLLGRGRPRSLSLLVRYARDARGVADYWTVFFFFFQAEDGIRDLTVTGVQTCALPISCCGHPRPSPEERFRLRAAPWRRAG